jgi:hypothetical protein
MVNDQRGDDRGHPISRRSDLPPEPGFVRRELTTPGTSALTGEAAAPETILDEIPA